MNLQLESSVGAGSPLQPYDFGKLTSICQGFPYKKSLAKWHGERAKIWEPVLFEDLPLQTKLYTIKHGYIWQYSFTPEGMLDFASEKQTRYMESLAKNKPAVARELKIVMADTYPNMTYPEQLNKGQAHFIIRCLLGNNTGIGTIIGNLLKCGVFVDWKQLLAAFSRYADTAEDETNPADMFCRFVVNNGYRPEHYPINGHYGSLGIEFSSKHIETEQKQKEEISALQFTCNEKQKQLDRLRIKLTRLNNDCTSKILDDWDRGIL